MKLLMIYTDSFGYKTSMKTLPEIPDISETQEIKNALIGFIHIEAQDQDKQNYIETKLIKNLKWAARKNQTEIIVLHSFAHLAECKDEPEFTKSVFDNAEERLVKSGYAVFQTPFGYFLDLKIRAPGHPLARLFKDI